MSSPTKSWNLPSLKPQTQDSLIRYDKREKTEQENTLLSSFHPLWSSPQEAIPKEHTDEQLKKLQEMFIQSDDLNISAKQKEFAVQSFDKLSAILNVLSTEDCLRLFSQRLGSSFLILEQQQLDEKIAKAQQQTQEDLNAQYLLQMKELEKSQKSFNVQQIVSKLELSLQRIENHSASFWVKESTLYAKRLVEHLFEKEIQSSGFWLRILTDMSEHLPKNEHITVIASSDVYHLLHGALTLPDKFTLQLNDSFPRGTLEIEQSHGGQLFSATSLLSELLEQINTSSLLDSSSN